MSTPQYRLNVSIDPYHYEDGPNGERLPEDEQTYSVNQIIREDGTPMPYDQYLKTYGDPDRYTGYDVTLQKQCECCQTWTDVESVGTSLYNEYVTPGVYELDKAHTYFQELAREMMP